MGPALKKFKQAGETDKDTQHCNSVNSKEWALEAV